MNASSQQEAIVSWALHGSGNLVIQARAGTGKTTTLLKMVKAITDARKGFMFLGAYNKSIAQELQVKLQDADVSAFDAEASTLHAAGFRIWRKVAPNVKVDENKVRKILFELTDGDKKMQGYLSEAGQAVSLAKQTGFWERDIPWTSIMDHFGIDILEDDLEDFYMLCSSAYHHSRAQDREVIDFDDMILCALGQPPVRTYDWVLLDEAQDTNPARRELAKLLLKPEGRFIAVGDDRQAIYGFTGADATAMDIIREEMRAQVLPLTISYRCPQLIIKEAQHYVPDIEAAPTALLGAVHRLKLVAKVDLENEFTPAMFRQDDAILCRLTRPLLKIAYALIRQKIPCKVEGRDIGKSLEKLVTRWKVPTLEMLVAKLEVFKARESEKLNRQGKHAQLANMEDKVDSLLALCEVLQDEGQVYVTHLLALIEKMFGSIQEAGRILTLSTIHKAKGKEWDRVFLLDNYMPSPYARKEWQYLQEQNLAYVAVTRARRTLTYLDDSPY